MKNKVTKEVKEALDEAGTNQQELEKVVLHYNKNPKDSLKFKAACFLIQNMKGYYSLTGENANKLEELYRIMGNTLPDARTEIYNRGVDSLKIEFIFSKHPDLQYIRAKFLIQHIDQAFKTWEPTPWHSHYSFNTFCEYVLPYRSLWSPLIEKQFKPQLDKIYFETGNLYEAENALFGKATVKEKFSASNYKAVTIAAKDKLIFENVCTEPGEKLLLIQHYSDGRDARPTVIINNTDTLPVVLKRTGGWEKPTANIVKVPIKIDRLVNTICLETKADKLSIDYVKVVPMLDFHLFRQSGISSGATYKITNKQNGVCLMIDNDSTKLASNIITSEFKNKNAQKFIMDYNDYGFFKIITHDKHNVVLDIPYGLIANGTGAKIFSYFNSFSQSWTLVPAREKG